jgi:hypothetical protein
MKYLFTVLTMLLATVSWSAYAADLPHFQCYHITDGNDAKKEATLKDQFRTKKVDVKRAHLLCAPVEKCVKKDDYSPEECTKTDLKGEHLKCYFIVPPGKPVGKEVTLFDQFFDKDKGGDKVKVINAHLLCTPADKEVKQPPKPKH